MGFSHDAHAVGRFRLDRRGPWPARVLHTTLPLLVFLALIGASLVALPKRAEAACSGNAVVCENELPGTPASEWDISGVGDPTIQGFATQMSVNAGSPISFKVDTDADAYTIKIYRLGYYQGNGAREVATVTPSASLPQVQPACATDSSTELHDCGTWGVSATWDVPGGAVSGIYIARLIRADTAESSHIPFVVRNDGNTSKVLFQTSDTTWQAYNTYGGSSLYAGGGNGRAVKLSYNRPWSTRIWQGGRDFLFSNEYPMVRFLEQNGYDVSYVSGLDVHADPSLLPKHKAFLSVGHDEYWSKEQRDNVLAGRNAGTNLAFLSGNEVYWKSRWEKSQDGTNTANRTLVCYKDTWANTQIDPVTPTATWRDPRFGDLGHGPENGLSGTLYKANNVDLAIKVNDTEGKLRLWRNTPLASLASGSTATLAPHTIGYESNEDRDNGFRPQGLVHLSTATGPVPEYLTDFGNTVVSGTTTHHLTLYRAPSGALVFSAGSIQWAWGLDSHHDGMAEPADQRIRQATVNLLADMDAPATTIAEDLQVATKSTDTTAPEVSVEQPVSGSSIAQGSLVTVSGTATDSGGRVAGVEVSMDGGASWHPATGRASFSYTGVLYGSGPGAIQVRAVDDSANIQPTPAQIAISSTCPCTLFGAVTPTTPAADDSTSLTLGTRIVPNADGFITGIRFYKGIGNTGTHKGVLYSETGAVLATGTFGNETETGWQMMNFASAVPVTADTTYVAAYTAPAGHYAAEVRFFSRRGFSSGQLSAPGGADHANAVYALGDRFPDETFQGTNYYVDAVYNTSDTVPLTVTDVSPPAGATSVPADTTISATFDRSIDPTSVSFAVLDAANNHAPGSTAYNAATKTATFTPTQPLANSTTYTVTVTAESASGANMAAPAQWSFTSAAAAPAAGSCPCTLFTDSDAPAATTSESDQVQLGVAFKPNRGGVVTGVRFYKGEDNTGTHTVSLSKTDGTRLATATMGSESTSGWQEASFDASVTVTANTTYIASYTAPNGNYSYTSGGLATPVVRGPLSSVSNGGRYTYGSGAPLSTSSTNYFVDPVFIAAGNSPAAVVAVSPGNDATSVPLAAPIRVTFDRPIEAGGAVITVKDPSGATVAGTTTSETASSSTSFVPSANLASGTRYTVAVRAASSESGTSTIQPFNSAFTTSGANACPCSLLETSAQPTLSDSGDGSPVTLGLKFSASVDGQVTGVQLLP